MLSFDPVPHRYTWNKRPIPSVTQCLATLFDFASIPPAVLERKRQIGVAVHRAIDLELNGTLRVSSVDPICQPYFDAFRRFRDECRFEPILIEYRVTNAELGESLRYGGTLDMWGTVQGNPAIVDWKTSMLVNAPAVGSQLAAYLRALIAMRFDASVSDRRFALQLGGDGRYRLRRFTSLDDDWQRFVLQLRATVVMMRTEATL